MLTYWYPTAAMPLETKVSATPLIRLSLGLHPKVFHEFQPMGGVAADGRRATAPGSASGARFPACRRLAARRHRTSRTVPGLATAASCATGAGGPARLLVSAGPCRRLDRPSRPSRPSQPGRRCQWTRRLRLPRCPKWPPVAVAPPVPPASRAALARRGLSGGAAGGSRPAGPRRPARSASLVGLAGRASRAQRASRATDLK